MWYYTWIKYELSKTPLRRPFYWYRHRGLTPADVIVACYPRSGSTWLRFMLSEILSSGSEGFDKVYELVPPLGGQARAPRVLPGSGRVVRTHEPYRKEYGKAIYVVRDLRDVLVSEHAYLCGRKFFRGELADFVTPFVRGEVNGYGNWRSHVESWIDSPLAEKGKLLLVKYENLRTETEATLNTIVEFLGCQPGTGAIQTAVEKNSLQQMKKKEQEAKETIFKSYPKDFRFVRRGSVGGWREDLTAAQIRLVEESAGSLLGRLGYSASSQAA